jgi:DNA-directed RNA polymerase subunit RPC12/RpoP
MNEQSVLDGGSDAVVQDVEVFKCDNCGNDLTFDPKSGKLTCEHCGTARDIEVSRDIEERPVDFNLDAQTAWAGETRTFKCDNCGATTTFDKAEFAGECAYCGSNKVMSIAQFDGIKPGALLPFALTAADAVKAWLNWLRRRWFAPGKMKKEATLDHVKGVYSPCWTFDARTLSHYHGIAGKYYYVTVGSGKNRRTERRIRYFPIKGTYGKDFKNLLVEASPHLNDEDMRRLRPFPLQHAVAYDKRFLSGFAADHYDCGLKDGWNRGAEMMRGEIRTGIRNSVNADVIQSLTVNTSFSDARFKHVLLPVYVTRSSFKDKVYNFFINGVNGNVSGKTPVGAGKVLATIGMGLVAAGIAALVFYLVGRK